MHRPCGHTHRADDHRDRRWRRAAPATGAAPAPTSTTAPVVACSRGLRKPAESNHPAGPGREPMETSSGKSRPEEVLTHIECTLSSGWEGGGQDAHRYASELRRRFRGERRFAPRLREGRTGHRLRPRGLLVRRDQPARLHPFIRRERPKCGARRWPRARAGGTPTSAHSTWWSRRRWPSARTSTTPSSSPVLNLPCTSAGWGPAATTSTTTSPAATATRPRRPPSRTSICPAAKTKPRLPCPQTQWGRPP